MSFFIKNMLGASVSMCVQVIHWYRSNISSEHDLFYIDN